MEFTRLIRTPYLALILFFVFPTSSHALGVGDISVQSNLNQYFNATIEITSSEASEINSLVAELAPKKAFNRMGIEFNPIYKSLEFTVIEDGEKPYIKVTSSKPIREPFVEFVLSLKWANGAIFQTYTVFMTPPSK